MENKIALSDLIELLAEQTELSNAESELFLKTLFELVFETLSNEDLVKIKDFGTFKLTRIQARESVDVNSGEKIEIPAHNRVNFVPSTVLKELVNKPFSHFETILLNEGVHFENMEQFFETDEDADEETDEKEEIIQQKTEPKKDLVKDKPAISSEQTVVSSPTEDTDERQENQESKKKFPAILIPVLGGVALAFASFFVPAKRK